MTCSGVSRHARRRGSQPVVRDVRLAGAPLERARFDGVFFDGPHVVMAAPTVPRAGAAATGTHACLISGRIDAEHRAVGAEQHVEHAARGRGHERRVLHRATGTADDDELGDGRLVELVGDAGEDGVGIEVDARRRGTSRRPPRRAAGRAAAARRRGTRTPWPSTPPSVATNRLTSCGVALISK